MNGDGTGTGKTRVAFAAILDQMAKGRKKVLWIAPSQELFDKAKAEWVSLGLPGDQWFNLSKISGHSAIPANDGIMFVSYGTLKAEAKPKKDAKGKAVGDAVARTDQISKWLGPDFDGVIVFDEAHLMGNAMRMQGGRGGQAPSATALAGLTIQQHHPNARVLYMTATAATEVANYAYAERLGLWGRGTAFADRSDFIGAMNRGGLAALEVLVRELKMAGQYFSRGLSFNDGTPEGTVTTERVEHALTPEQREIYDTCAEAWSIIYQGFMNGVSQTATGHNGRPNGRASATPGLPSTALNSVSSTN